ncbi:hypothetical protein GF402_08005 [Candidatus Fermentibacteria bacterium]|nr:hypothetical protein [Candidatus Fermentibacteria bacterium]
MDDPVKNPLERLEAAQRDLSRLLGELRRFEEKLNGIARDMESLPPATGEGGAPPQSVSRADAPVVEESQSQSGRDD